MGNRTYLLPRDRALRGWRAIFLHHEEEASDGGSSRFDHETGVLRPQLLAHQPYLPQVSIGGRLPPLCRVSNACYYLYLYRDIKPENFLLYKEDDDSHVKLIDFGLAKRVGNNEVMNAPNGTPYYIAPEVLKGSYTTQCDNWSMGIVLFIMLSGKPPFGGKSNKEIIDNVLRGSYSFSTPVWENISDQAKDFISKLLTRQADERLTAEEAYNHPWLAE